MRNTFGLRIMNGGEGGGGGVGTDNSFCNVGVAQLTLVIDVALCLYNIY